MAIYYGNAKQAPVQGGGGIVFTLYKGNMLLSRPAFDPVTFTGSATWEVPKGIHKIRVDCVGACGALGGGDRIDHVPGYGGRVQTVLSVDGIKTLYITVGTVPTSWVVPNYNASDVRIGPELTDRVIVAGGGGSGRHTSNGQYGSDGGNGGGLTGAAGTAQGTYGYPGQGGTQTAGGAGGSGLNSNGEAGTFGLGGKCVDSGTGAGGAGWYGGGAGGWGAHKSIWVFGGGGGGSSYTHPALCSEVEHTQGFMNGAGYVSFSMVE